MLFRSEKAAEGRGGWWRDGERRRERWEEGGGNEGGVSHSLSVSNNSCKEEVLSHEVVEVFAVSNSAVVDLTG